MGCRNTALAFWMAYFLHAYTSDEMRLEASVRFQVTYFGYMVPQLVYYSI